MRSNHLVLCLVVLVLVPLLIPAFPGQRPSAQNSNQRPAPPDTAATSTIATKTLESLSLRGPDFPEVFDTSDLSMYYVVRGNWPIVLRYELPAGSGTLSLRTQQRGNPISVRLWATPPGEIGKATLYVPKEYGSDAQPAELTIKARAENNEPASLVIHSLGCGGGAFVDTLEKLRRLNGFHHSENSWGRALQDVAFDEVALGGIVLSPPDTLLATLGTRLLFSFKSASDFALWSAKFQRQVQNGGSRWKVERTLPFSNDPIGQGKTKSQSWDGRDERGRVVPGRYKIMVSAWTSVSQDGSAVTSFSSPAFAVK